MQLTAVSKKLTKMTESEPARHRLWAELAGDSRLESLRFGTLGWVPRKEERVQGVHDRFALCVLRPGSTGTLRERAGREAESVRGPGVFFVTPGQWQDYGPESSADQWEEFYWIVEGARAEEWRRLGWWPAEPHFWPTTRAREARLWAMFRAGGAALEARDARALERAKLALERCLSEGPWVGKVDDFRARESSVLRVAEAWRRDLARDWDLRAGAREAGLSYTRFRERFTKELGRSPHAHLTQLRMELARRWLSATREPIKAIALHCGYSSSEPFIRAFTKAHGTTPARWRAAQAPSPDQSPALTHAR